MFDSVGEIVFSLLYFVNGILAGKMLYFFSIVIIGWSSFLHRQVSCL